MTSTACCGFAAVIGSCVLLAAGSASGGSAKTESSLYPPWAVAQLRENAAENGWAVDVRRKAVADAESWLQMSDEALWDLMFGATITRSWMVWSNGHCPSCSESVPMYTWKMDVRTHPWKVQCPHCSEFFPKNDFHAFYQSGLDEQRVFDPARADRSLLFNAENPEPDDPLHGFGVDDGEGYVDGDKRWRFIGAYLIYGQWKSAVLGGIGSLSSAYLFTGEQAYAHKAAILLDRVADLYPSFDFEQQGLAYEKGHGSGYVSTWHDACAETKNMALRYDMIYPAIQDDAELVAFLSAKARECGLANAKTSEALVCENIETRILRDALVHEERIHCNYPATPVAKAIILFILGGEEERRQADEVIDAMLKRTTAVDGVTGEKGMAAYAAFPLDILAHLLGEMSKADPDCVKALLKRHPRLHETYRFHIDMRCLDRYYPQSGDTGGFALPHSRYAAIRLARADDPGRLTPGPPSMFTLLWRFYEATGDTAFVQLMYEANGNTTEGLPHDLYVSDPAPIRKGVSEVIAQEGPDIRLGCVDKQEWRLAILRSGEGADRHAVWLDYDSGGGHGHYDGMNLGLFAKGLDLMPEFGYPAVQYGGWGSPRARWYACSAAHNTVVVDGANTERAAGKTTLWADGTIVRAIRVDGAPLNHGRRYERTVLLVDVSPNAFYVADVFRVAGGSDHIKFTQSHYGTVKATGLAPEPAPDYGHGTFMRNLRLDPAAQPGWHVDWTVEDRLGLLPEGARVRVRYTDLTTDAQGGLAEAWISHRGYKTTEDTWIPRAVVRRQSKDEEELESTFVAVIEVYEDAPAVQRIERPALQNAAGQPLADTHVVLSIALTDGRRDLIILRDPQAAVEGPITLATEPKLTTDAETCFIRLSPSGTVEHLAVAHGSHATIDAYKAVQEPAPPFWERGPAGE